MTKYNNPLSEFIDDNGTLQPVEVVDIDFLFEEGDELADEDWFDKIYGLIGHLVVRFNSLEDSVENMILAEFSDRAEDARAWVFMERMSTMQKVDALFRIIEVNMNILLFWLVTRFERERSNSGTNSDESIPDETSTCMPTG